MPMSIHPSNFHFDIGFEHSVLVLYNSLKARPNIRSAWRCLTLNGRFSKVTQRRKQLAATICLSIALLCVAVQYSHAMLCNANQRWIVATTSCAQFSEGSRQFWTPEVYPKFVQTLGEIFGNISFPPWTIFLPTKNIIWEITYTMLFFLPYLFSYLIKFWNYSFWQNFEKVAKKVSERFNL